MGRYYDGDIEGKFWFGIQDTSDGDFFGKQHQNILENFHRFHLNKHWTKNILYYFDLYKIVLLYQVFHY